MMKGKVALVIGGATGIGLATAARLAREGASVFVTGRRAEQVEAAAQGLGPAAQGLVADAGRSVDLQRVVAAIRASRGRIDALVLNAGASSPAILGEETEEHFDALFGVNVRGPLLALQAALPVLGRGSAVVLIGSVAGQAGVPAFGTYAATKAALRSYARTWTAELAPQGIRVNVVSPGPTSTAMMEALPDEVRSGMVARIPLGRMATPDEVASAAVFLLSDQASFITGAELSVDGGAKQV